MKILTNNGKQFIFNEFKNHMNKYLGQTNPFKNKQSLSKFEIRKN